MMHEDIACGIAHRAPLVYFEYVFSLSLALSPYHRRCMRKPQFIRTAASHDPITWDILDVSARGHDFHVCMVHRSHS
jgi:hypothetical protein